MGYIHIIAACSIIIVSILIYAIIIIIRDVVSEELPNRIWTRRLKIKLVGLGKNDMYRAMRYTMSDVSRIVRNRVFDRIDLQKKELEYCEVFKCSVGISKAYPERFKNDYKLFEDTDIVSLRNRINEELRVLTSSFATGRGEDKNSLFAKCDIEYTKVDGVYKVIATIMIAKFESDEKSH